VPVIAALVLLMAQAPAAGQASGASIPRMADSKPDFSGIWQTMNGGAWNVEDTVEGPEGVRAAVDDESGN
jgi:hypothetical protein